MKQLGFQGAERFPAQPTSDSGGQRVGFETSEVVATFFPLLKGFPKPRAQSLNMQGAPNLTPTLLFFCLFLYGDGAEVQVQI